MQKEKPPAGEGRTGGFVDGLRSREGEGPQREWHKGRWPHPTGPASTVGDFGD